MAEIVQTLQSIELVNQKPYQHCVAVFRRLLHLQRPSYMKETTTAESQKDDTLSRAAECHGHSKAQSKSLVCVMKSCIGQMILFFPCV